MSDGQIRLDGTPATESEKPKRPTYALMNLKQQEILREFSWVTQKVDELSDLNRNLTPVFLESNDKLDNLTEISNILLKRMEAMGSAPMSQTSETPVAAAPVASIMDTSAREYVTSREIFDNYKKQLSRRDGELANSKFKNLLEKICLLREDYVTLCRDMRKNLETFSPEDVLDSFEAYLIDFENMLMDAGITMGPYGSAGDQVDVAHQRIISVVPTSDPAKNGTVAQRLSDCYEFEGTAVIKEKVNVYKLATQAEASTKPEEREILG